MFIFIAVLSTDSGLSSPRDSRSPKGLFISRTCTGVNCKTCLNDKCYDVNGPVFACGKWLIILLMNNHSVMSR